MNDTSYRVALGGVISSLCLMMMFMTSLTPLLYLVMPMFAGLLLIVIISEISVGWAFLTYISVSMLSMLVTFNKESALMFIMFFGHYPMLKLYIEKLKFRPLRVIIKFVLYNVCTAAEMLAVIYIFGIDDVIKEMNDMGRYGFWIMLGMNNAMFVSYDTALTSCSLLYKKWLKPKILLKK